MSKRIKRVFTSADQVLHLWANQTQDSARSANVFFEGENVYSYGLHYKLGKLHTVKGKRIAVINTTRYSATTAKHQSYARGAVSHMLSLGSSNPDCLKTALTQTQDGLVSTLFDALARRKFWGSTERELGEYVLNLDQIEAFNQVCNALNRKDMRIDVPVHFIELVKAHVKSCAAKNIDMQAKRQEKALKKLPEEIAAWRTGGPLTNALRSLPNQLIRINGDVLQTTKGAQIPLTNAVQAYRFLKQGTLRVGDTVGAFSVTQLHKEYVKIGCHTIDLSEAKALFEPNQVLEST